MPQASNWLSRHRLSVWLVAIHAMLVLMLGFVSGNSAMHDQSPLMMLPLLVYGIDLPVHMLLRPFVAVSESAEYLSLLLLVGSVYWWAIGMIVRALIVTAQHDAAQNRLGRDRSVGQPSGQPLASKLAD